MRIRPGFTLLELLIAIALFSIITVPLYKVVILLKESNTQIETKMGESKKDRDIVNTLYLDIAGSLDEITVEEKEYTRLCIDKTTNSLYSLSNPRVCWVVTKDNRLLRTEGFNYNLPLNYNTTKIVQVDDMVGSITTFKVYYSPTKILVFLKMANRDMISFVVNGFFEEGIIGLTVPEVF